MAAGLVGLSATGCSKQAAGPTGANRAIYDYLGAPVVTPSNVDAAYTKDGLTRAIKTAARTADVPLARVEIDDSEFPFLVGLVCVHGEDLEKLKDEIRTMPIYNFSGGVSSHTSYVMNLVPPGAFPVEGRDRIYRRMAVRERMLYDKISGRH